MRHLPAFERLRDTQCKVKSARLSISAGQGHSHAGGTGMPCMHGVLQAHLSVEAQPSALCAGGCAGRSGEVKARRTQLRLARLMRRSVSESAKQAVGHCPLSGLVRHQSSAPVCPILMSIPVAPTCYALDHAVAASAAPICTSLLPSQKVSSICSAAQHTLHKSRSIPLARQQAFFFLLCKTAHLNNSCARWRTP